jgi:hypothetical protein
MASSSPCNRPLAIASRTNAFWSGVKFTIMTFNLPQQALTRLPIDSAPTYVVGSPAMGRRLTRIARSVTVTAAPASMVA